MSDTKHKTEWDPSYTTPAQPYPALPDVPAPPAKWTMPVSLQQMPPAPGFTIDVVPATPQPPSTWPNFSVYGYNGEKK